MLSEETARLSASPRDRVIGERYESRMLRVVAPRNPWKMTAARGRKGKKEFRMFKDRVWSLLARLSHPSLFLLSLDLFRFMPPSLPLSIPFQLLAFRLSFLPQVASPLFLRLRSSLLSRFLTAFHRFSPQTAKPPPPTVYT